MTTLDCTSCADERAAGAAFCEACGKALDGPRCPSCGAADGVAADGYCQQCGILAGRPRDRLETDGGAAGAAVTDRGRRHHRNEDAMFLAVRDGAVDVVVCDGVSASFDPDVASAAAATTAGQVLASAESAEDVGDAIARAQKAVAALAAEGDPRRAASNPACTIVAACVRAGTIGYGWIGDSRAYWVPLDGPAEQLTEDDSWAFHAVAMGADPATAMQDPKAHAITAWLGADSGPVQARTGGFTVFEPGLLVLCTDGLWNYLPDLDAFASTVRTHAAAGPIEGARALTAFANDAGGSDNITVALIPVSPA